MDLAYRATALVEDLSPNECAIHRASNGNARWWLLWLYVYRDDVAGVLENFAVPVNPNGGYLENGPGGRTWGLTRTGAGIWQVSPSINILNDTTPLLHQGPHPTLPSRWHQTPRVVGVPDDAVWTTGAP